MASILDLGLLQFFKVIFPTLLVFVVIYAVLQKTKVVGAKKPIDAIVAIACAILTAISASAIDLITFIAPWFELLFLGIVLFFFAFRVMGYDEGFISSVLKNNQYGTGFFWVTIAIGAMIIFAGVGSVFGDQLISLTGDIQDDGEFNNAENADINEYEQNIIKTIIHPKVVGAGIFLLICVLAVAMLTGSP